MSMKIALPWTRQDGGPLVQGRKLRPYADEQSGLTGAVVGSSARAAKRLLRIYICRGCGFDFSALRSKSGQTALETAVIQCIAVRGTHPGNHASGGLGRLI
jgi:hypothetical protein